MQEQPPVQMPPPQIHEDPVPNFGFYGRFKNVIWISLVIITIAVAGLVGYAIFFRNSSTTQDHNNEVAINIKAPLESPSGSDISYVIDYQNSSNSTLTEVAVEVFAPAGFTFLGSNPESENDSGRKFVLPNVGRGETGEIIVHGRLEGAISEIKTFGAKIHYVPENFRSGFEVSTSVSTTLLTPDISLKVNAPAQTVSGQTITYEVEISNISQRKFSDLELVLTYPQKFSTNDADTFPFPVLEVGESKRFVVSGSLADDPGIDSFVLAELFWKNDNGERVSAGRSFAFTRIMASPLALEHKLLKAPKSFVPGETLTYEVDYENRGAVGLHNVVITLVFENPVLNLLKARSQKGQTRQNTIVFVPPAASELAVVDPGQKGKFEVEVPIADDLVARQIKNPTIASRVEFVSNELGSPTVGNTLAFKVESQIKIIASAVVVSGPVKPVAGQPTTYRMTLTVTNTVNDIREALVEAIVPRVDVTFDPSSVLPADERDNVNFTEVAGALHWNLTDLFAFTGSFHAPRTLSFNLTLTPQSVPPGLSDFVLLQEIQVSGHDEFLDEAISSNKIQTLSTPR